MGYELNFKHLNSLSSHIQKKQGILIGQLDAICSMTSKLSQMSDFQGEAATALKDRQLACHALLTASMTTLMNTLANQMLLYKYDCYQDIDNKKSAVIVEDTLDTHQRFLDDSLQEYTDLHSEFIQLMNDYSDLVPVQYDNSESVKNHYSDVYGKLSTFKNTFVSNEENHLDFSAFDTALADCRTLINQYLEEPMDIASLPEDVPEKFDGLIDSLNLVYTSGAENSDKLSQAQEWESEQENKKKSIERTSEGAFETIAGGMLIAVGCTAVSVAMAATAPIWLVVGGAVAGGAAIAYGIADASEGVQNIYYGIVNDNDSVSVNVIRDGLFHGNQNAYFISELVVSAAAGGFGIYGHALASKAGQITTIVGEELPKVMTEQLSKSAANKIFWHTIFADIGAVATGTLIDYGSTRAIEHWTGNKILAKYLGFGVGLVAGAFTGFKLNGMVKKIPYKEYESQLYKMTQQNVKYNESKMIFIEEISPNDLPEMTLVGESPKELPKPLERVWLDDGKDSAGLEHILDGAILKDKHGNPIIGEDRMPKRTPGHANDFKDGTRKVSREEVPSFLYRVLNKGKIVTHEVEWNIENSRYDYTLVYEYNGRKITFGVGDNGYIVTAYPDHSR